MMQGSVRLAVDVGGTFTDLQAVEESTGRCVSFKTPTTPEDPSAGLMCAVLGAAERHGFSLDQVSMLMHGTTIATNAVLEDTLPRGALITTRGFRDVLEIGRHVREDIYAPRAESRRLLVPRARRHEVDERVAADGTVLRPLDEDGVHALAAQLAEAGVETVAVCLLHAYANPDHERRVGAIVASVLGSAHVSLSHAVSPEIREFERTSTTALNALLMPVIEGYLARLRERMEAHRFAPVLYLVQSNGGVTSAAAAAEQPARLLLSGPSGGALATETIGTRLERADLVAIDMGGTSFDVSVVHGGRSRVVTEGEVADCPVRLPMIEIRTIGAGGGSVARADDTGRLLVGPRSAGARPGPAAYGRGGEEATVTDANVVLGRIDPAHFLGGAMVLDLDRAHRAVQRVAARLDLGETETAAGIVQVAVVNMAAAIRLSLFEKGLDPKDFALVSFGGAGGLHAIEAADELGAREVVFPRDAGTLSAWGMLYSDVVHDCARSRLLRAEPAAAGPLGDMARSLLDEGREKLERDRIPPARRHYALSADMRYPGQAYEITVPVDGQAIDQASLAHACARFHDLHQQRFAHSDRRRTPEIVTLRLAAVGRLDKPAQPRAGDSAAVEPRAVRRAWLDGAWCECPVHARDALGAGARLDGPALVEEEYATIVLPAGWVLECRAAGDLTARRT